MAKRRRLYSERAKPAKPYESKKKMSQLLGFDTEDAFSKWRVSNLVKPTWEGFERKFLDTALSEASTKGLQFEEVHTEIIEGEARGRRHYSTHPANATYDTALEWHAWAVYWLVNENTADWKGCFFGKHLDKAESHKIMFIYLTFEKRQRRRRATAVAQGKRPRTSKAPPKDPSPIEESSDSEDEEHIDLDPEQGVAIVRWDVPPALWEENIVDKVKIQEFCGYTPAQFSTFVTAHFELDKHKQRLVSLEATDKINFRAAQVKSMQTGKPVTYRLMTREADISEEGQSVVDSDLPPSNDMELH